MKTILITLMMTVMTAMTTGAFNYTVEGTVKPEMEGKTLYILTADDGNSIDSTKVTDGKFRFEGTADESRYCNIAFKEAVYGGVRTNYIAQVITEPGLTVMDMEKLLSAEGGPLNTKLAALWVPVMEKQAVLSARIQQLQADSLLDQETMARKGQEIFDEWYGFVKPLLRNAIRTENNNAVGESALRTYAHDCTPEEWHEVYEVLGPDLKNLKFVREHNKRVSNIANTSEGKRFADLTGTTPDGSAAHLSDYVGKGKYVLVDFWASWCAPCRAEAQETLMPLYEKYKDNDRFMILGVMTWDDAGTAKAAIQKLGYKWPQIIDTDSAASGTYGFDSIPMIMLFGPDGTVVARGIRGTEITKKVAEVLAAEAN